MYTVQMKPETGHYNLDKISQKGTALFSLQCGSVLHALYWNRWATGVGLIGGQYCHRSKETIAAHRSAFVFLLEAWSGTRHAFVWGIFADYIVCFCVRLCSGSEEFFCTAEVCSQIARIWRLSRPLQLVRSGPRDIIDPVFWSCFFLDKYLLGFLEIEHKPD